MIKTASIFAITLATTAPSFALASDAMDKFVDLYEELITFKDSKKFQEVGYGQCCEYSEWADRVKDFNRQESMEVLRAVEAVPMDLWTIGKNHFSRNREIRESAAERLSVIGDFIEIYNSSEVAGKGEGTVAMTDPACEEYSVFEEFADYMMEQKYSEAGEVLDEAIERGECQRILKGTIVSGPHSKRDGKLGDLVQIKTNSGKELWVLESNIEFEQ